MIIAYPDDGRGFLYHIVDLLGRTVHAYRDFSSALRVIEGDQRLCIQDEDTGKWVTDAPTPVTMPLGEMEKIDPHIFTNPDLARADRLLTADELREKYSTAMHGGEHPKYALIMWRQQVWGWNTQRGYWDWVAAQLEEEE